MTDKAYMAPITTLVVDHHADVYRYAYRLTGSVADAEDLTQQTFLIAQRKLSQLRSNESARGWLYAILRSSYLKSLRRPRPMNAASIALEVDELPAEADRETFVDTERLQQALDDLPHDAKLVLLMFYFEECGYRDIAERLDIPIGTVMSRLSRAKARLRARLFELEWRERDASNRQPTKVGAGALDERRQG